MRAAHGTPGPTGKEVPSGAELAESGEVRDAGEEGAVGVASEAGHAAGGVHEAELEASDSDGPPPASRAEAPGNDTQPTKTGSVDTSGTGPIEGQAVGTWAAVAAGGQESGTKPGEEAKLQAVAQDPSQGSSCKKWLTHRWHRWLQSGRLKT